MAQQAHLFAPQPEAPDYPADLPALVRRLARKLASLDGGDPDAPPVVSGGEPAWHYCIDNAAEILEYLTALLAGGQLLTEVVSRRRQASAARVLRDLLNPAP